MRNRLVDALLLGVVAAVFSSGCVTTQGRVILGAVMDNDNHPIAGAIVTTDPPTSSVATDNLGRYVLRLEKEGVYSVRADILGYVGEPVAIEVKGGDITQADIKLLPEGLISTSEATSPVPAVEEAPPATEDATPIIETDPAQKKKWWEK